jgi:prevent-host-death family protein
MAETASIAEARADLSAYINRVAHGGQRIVLTSRGKSKAALVSLADLEALENELARQASILAALADSDKLVEQIRRRRGGESMSDSAEDIHRNRVERMYELTGIWVDC